jgi:lipopolysaccharide transport system ATP-binding protein
MTDIAIRVDNLSKQYRIGGPQASYQTLRESLVAAAQAPFRRLSSIVHRPSSADAPDTIWALKDVSFEVKRGEVLGIIGRNGAGKSTLLKILSRITMPTEGTVDLYGRVGSLLEVGTGFHPELTGRENVYLNGAILGMKRAEIDRKFDEIVAFAEIEKFLDTPIKHYSSGMYVRLAFAVAAHLDPEILLVDEVLAVGDAAFQKKCLGKMGEVAGEGRTVLFVSHNMTAVTQLCPSAILIGDGRIVCCGSASHVVAKYLSRDDANRGERVWENFQHAPGNERIRLRSVRIISDERISSEIDIDKELLVEVEYWNLVGGTRNVCANIYLLDSKGTIILSTANTPSASVLPNEWFSKPHPSGLFRATCTVPGNLLNEGVYHLNVYVVTLGPLNVAVQAEQVLSFEVFDTGEMREAGGGQHWAGVIRLRLPWDTKFVQPLGRELTRSQSQTR